MLQYKIPQNVQIEDKIFGNILTLRELIFLAIGGGISYVIYTLLSQIYILGFIEVLILCTPLYIAGGFAFFRIYDLPLLQVLLLLIEFALKPSKRVWNKSAESALAIDRLLPSTETLADEAKQFVPVSKDQIAEMSKVLNLGELTDEQGRKKIYPE